MNITDLLSPLFRRKGFLLILFLLFFGILFGSSQFINNKYKTTLYFSVKPTQELPATNHYYAAEGAERIAEMLSGWIKNPAFRDQIQTKAETKIGHFRKKISARKQNRINVFVTLTLSQEESTYATKIAQATYDTYQERLAQFNTNSSATFALLEPTIASELRAFPLSWFAIGAFIIGLALSIIGVYIFEMLQDRVSFIHQIKNLFPESPLLRIHKKIGQHDGEFLEHFILSLESPQLIGTFPAAYEHFSLQDNYGLNPVENTPVILVQLGVTTVRELENIKALFEENIALIVFEK